MKNSPIDPDDEPGRSILGEWKIETPLPPRFQEQVWRRIERSATDTPIRLWPTLLNWLRGTVMHPVVGYAYAVVLLALGVTVGLLQAQRENTRLDDLARTRYVQSVDPYQKVGGP
jgi:hypothetical protein